MTELGNSFGEKMLTWKVFPRYLQESHTMWKYLFLVIFSYSTFVHGARLLPRSDHSKSKGNKGRELVYLQILTSNGHFHPLSLYPNDENTEGDWPNGMGALSQLGKLQHYNFGKFLRKFYDSFITSNFLEVDSFSSMEDRSTLSLLSLMASLYEPTEEWQFFPGLKWQPITINYLEEEVHDPFFGYPDECSAQIREAQNILTSEPIQELTRKDKFLYSNWANNSGLPIENFNDVADLYDTIQKEIDFGLQVPMWAKEHMDDMKRVSDSAYRWRYNSTKSLQLKAGLLMDFMRIRMRVHHMKENPTPHLKVSVYMTHDWNIATVLSAMRLFNGRRPPPCATLAFEFYRQSRHEDDDAFEHSVRILFFNSTRPELGHQEPNLMPLEGCDAEFFCPLSHFVRFFDYVVPDNYTALCERFVDTPNVDHEVEEPTIYPMYHDMLGITESPSPL